MTRFGRFEIRGELGRGGMGVVLRGWDPDMAREVAIKVLRADASLSESEREEIRARFDREARAAGGLNHPGIVAVFERGEIGGNRFIVMELVEGRPLSDLMAGPRLDPGQSISILRQMAAALDYAHGRGVIHRDVKPANVLVLPGGAVKMADFGIAKCAAAGGATSSSVIIGSPHYMAPEQVEARAVDGRTDQWALAVTSWEMLAGAKPFQSDSVAGLFRRILSGAPEPPGESAALSPEVRQVFSRALSKDPGARFETCEAFVAALEQAAMPGKPEAGAVSRRRQVVVRVRPAWAAGAFAFLAVFAATLWWAAARFAGGTDQAPDGRAAGTTPRAGEVRQNARDGLEYVWIAPGRFRMGCSPGDAECHKDEPAHEVSIRKGYWIGRTEVTAGAYGRFCLATGGRPPPPPDFNPGWENESMPATGISWEAASRFCRWAEGRLPTEAEWEYAARAGAEGARYGDIDRIAWTRRNSGLRAHDARGLEPNAHGLFDMLGNVWEWTADRYGEQYYLRSPASDPPGPESGHFRVLRGGSWIRHAPDVRVSNRYPVLPDDPDHAVGFRCAAGEMP